MDETVTVYITKYALTSGIIKCEGVIHNNRFFAWSPKKFSALNFSSSEFVLTELEAQKVFEEKRLIGINRLDLLLKKTLKRIEKLKNLKMEIKE